MTAEADHRPDNILFVFSDQHRHDVLGCAGHPLVATPNLDRIAAEGVRFTRTWCQSPICQPSRASVITGRYPSELGVVGNTGGFDPGWPTVMKNLQAVGYETATIGKTHYHESYAPSGTEPFDMRDRAPFVQQFGWDHVLEEYDKYLHCAEHLRTPYVDHLDTNGHLDAYRQQIRDIFRLTPTHWRGETSVLPPELDLTNFLADQATDWLRGRDAARPFFLKLAFVQPHVPLVDDATWADHYADAPVEVPDLTRPEKSPDIWAKYLGVLDDHSQVQTMDPEFVRSGIRHYLGMVSLIDQRLGDVLQTLDELGELERTWVVYTCDHGEMLGSQGLWAKMNFFAPSVQVPLLVRPPGGRPPRIDHGLTELVDVTATLAAIGGAEPPAGGAGRSLLPALDGDLPGREQVASRIGNFAGIRTDRYRATVHVPSGTPCELFDLIDDPDETTNRVADRSLAGTRDELIDALVAHEHSLEHRTI